VLLASMLFRPSVYVRCCWCAGGAFTQHVLLYVSRRFDSMFGLIRDWRSKVGLCMGLRERERERESSGCGCCDTVPLWPWLCRVALRTVRPLPRGVLTPWPRPCPSSVLSSRCRCSGPPYDPPSPLWCFSPVRHRWGLWGPVWTDVLRHCGGGRVWVGGGCGCLRVPRAPSPVSHLCTPLALGVHPRGQGFKGLLSAGAGKSKEYMAQKLAKQKVPFFR
jgi:hypothetical protein